MDKSKAFMRARCDFWTFDHEFYELGNEHEYESGQSGSGGRER